MSEQIEKDSRLNVHKLASYNFDDEANKNNELTESIRIKVSSSELAILTKKAKLLGRDKETLLREYIIDANAAFDDSVFEGKKCSKPVKVGSDNE